MSEYDIHSNMKADNALDGADITSNTTTTGEIIDTALFEALEFVVRTSALTDGSYAVSMEDGDDSGLSDAAAVSTDDTIGVASALTVANTVTRVGYGGKKQFVRVVITSTSVTTGAHLSAVGISMHAHHQPVADQ